jgi:SAM-dependent methyltransferase
LVKGGADMDHLEEIKDYWTLRAEGYSNSVVDELKTERSKHWLDIIGSYVDVGGSLDVLDIGTGPGFFPILMGREGHNVTAIDYTEAMLDMAKKNCAEFGIDAKFQRMDAQNLTFPDGSFDLVISRNLVWDLEMPLRAYKEWFRVLRPNGKMLIFDGNHYLHLYDEDYARMESEKEDKGGRGASHQDVLGVDTNIIKEIARDLPLSKERRPQWDVDVLIKLGAASITIEMEGNKTRYVKKDDGEESLPFNFILCARK